MALSLGPVGRGVLCTARLEASRSKKRRSAWRDVQSLPPTGSVSSRTPLRPREAQRYKVDVLGGFPFRLGGSSLAAAPRGKRSPRAVSGSVRFASHKAGAISPCETYAAY
jgi:hypothetical protein